VLDLSGSGLARTQSQLGELSSRIRWIEADVTSVPELDEVDVWHDRALFHFLVDAEDRRSYIELASKTVVKAGHAIVATFGPEGPTHCSGLPVTRYDAGVLASEFGLYFQMVHSAIVDHVTPGGATQQFVYALLQRDTA
jgi:hypothetical protein